MIEQKMRKKAEVRSSVDALVRSCDQFVDRSIDNANFKVVPAFSSPAGQPQAVGYSSDCIFAYLTHGIRVSWLSPSV